ncbi:MAG: 50S ribosomal protein L30 [Acidobacteria bacterium]|nr:50S ribosomal protein L30 [Acidobacteriota bacterium]
MSTVKVQLVRSTIGTLKKHRLVVKSLGLNRLHQVRELKDCPEVRGQIKKVDYLVKVLES